MRNETSSYYSRQFIIYRKTAHKKKKEWALTKEEFISIIIKRCFYCNEIPRPRSRYERFTKMKFIPPMNGIDRVDSSKGYTKENLVPCCTSCNSLKSNLTMTYFFKKLSDIVRKHPLIFSQSDQKSS